MERQYDITCVLNPIIICFRDCNLHDISKKIFDKGLADFQTTPEEHRRNQILDKELGNALIYEAIERFLEDQGLARRCSYYLPFIKSREN